MLRFCEILVALDSERKSRDELLSTLKGLVRMVDGTLQGYGILETAMNQARAAIAKAEGGVA
jgi:hypothetical protein